MKQLHYECKKKRPPFFCVITVGGACLEVITLRHKNTRSHQKFPVKTVITSTYSKSYNFDMKKQYQKCKGKSSPNIPCLTGRETRNGLIPFERSVPRVI